MLAAQSIDRRLALITAALFRRGSFDLAFGGVAERLKAPVLKTGSG
jgi:hypothetical protein